ncbi:MAG: hypothetical protein AAF602_21515 [Myxococcota bacterium]
MRASLLLLAVLPACHIADAAFGRLRTEDQIRPALERAFEEVQAVRGPFDLPNLRLVTPEERAAEMRRLLREAADQPGFVEGARLERAFGLAISDDRAVELYSTNVPAWYEPETDTMVIASPWRDDAAGRMMLRHELAHARQDQLYDLLDMRNRGFDGSQALRWVFEGDACLTDALAVRATAPPSDEPLWRALPLPARFEGTEAERFQQQIAYQPYHWGSSSLARRFEESGWEAVDALLRDPPATTRAVWTRSAFVDEVPFGPPVLPPGAVAAPAFSIGMGGLAALLRTDGDESHLAQFWETDRFVPFELDGEPGYHWVLRVRSGHAWSFETAFANGLPGEREETVLRRGNEFVIVSVHD